MRSRLIALAAMAALFFSPAYAAPVYVPGQQGTVGPNVACTNSDGATVRCIQPSVTLNDATGAAIGTSGNPLVTSPGTGTTGDVNVKQVNGATVNVGTGAAGTGTQRVTTSTDSTIATVGAVTAITQPLAPALAVPSTNASTTVTLGATYQTVFASSTARRGCAIQNPTTATEILSVRVKGVAVFTLPVGATFNCGALGDVVISDLIEVTATTTGHAFTAISQ